jgi:hypothetical protein
MSVVSSRAPVMTALQQLVATHRELQDEPLLLAVHYVPSRNPNDVFLFEVVDGFGANRVTDEQDLFEVGFPSDLLFPVQATGQLRLILTNPVEFDVANRDHWAKLEELRQAVLAGRSTVVYADPDWQDWESRLNA